VISYNVAGQSQQGTTTFTDMFSYWASGQIKGKRLRVTKVNPYTQSGQHFQTAVGDLNMSYTYNAEGKLTNVTYPLDSNNNTPQYNYSYDAMMRANAMTDQSSSSIVSGVQFGAANQVLSMNYDSGTETRTYNNMLQLTNLTFASATLNQNITYTFPSGTNNGKISSQTDSLSGETVTYQYDSLNRLIQAQGSGWGQTYTYDGFGNLTNRAGSGTAPSMSTPVNANNNQLSSGAGYFYDANGNLLSTGNLYDVENRLRQATIPGGTIQYAYDGSNKRVWQGSFTSSGDPQLLNYGDLVSMFGIDGQLAGTYTALPAWTNLTTPTTISFQVNAQRVYFGKKLLAWMDGGGTRHSAVADRVGSVGKYYPYGEERNSPTLPGDQVKFATYTRDSVTGNDYANQRYYTNTLATFTSPDPSGASGGTNDSGSWNRYAYTRGDPINRHDTNGMSDCGVDSLSPLCDADGASGADFGGGSCYVDGMMVSTQDPACSAPISLESTFSLGVILLPIIGGGSGGGGGQSGSSPPCNDWSCMPAAMAQVLLDLAKPGCSAVFAGGIAKGHDPAQVLMAIVAGTTYGSVTFSIKGAGTAATERRAFSLRKRVVININSGLYPDGIYWNNGVASVNAITLLHELGHAFNDLFGKNSSTIINDVSATGKMIQSAEDKNAEALRPCEQ
jgi:RHS repeat-associated protein